MIGMEIDHIADSLRQHLQCTADVSVITYKWTRGADRPIPTVQNARKCRNYDDVMSWALKHQAPAPPGGMVTKPTDGSVRETVVLILGDDGEPMPDWEYTEDGI